MDKEPIICSCLILTISLLLSPASSDPLLTMCLMKRISNNTALERNLDELFRNLTPQTVSSNGFFSCSAGDDSNKVNAQALCRGDANATVCKNCLESAIREVKNCWTSEAASWHESCQVYYALREFVATMEDRGHVPEKRYYSRGNVSRKTEFEEGLKRLIESLLRDDELSNPNIMFATRDIRYYKEGRIYGLAQCARDIDASKCRTCLQSAWGDLMHRSSFEEGGIMLSRSCNVRFEVYPFYNTSSLKAQVKSKHAWRNWKVVLVASCASMALLILICSLFVCLLWKNGSNQDESTLLQSTRSPLATMMSSVHSEFSNTDELPLIDLCTILVATNEFSDSNKLGQGGFGTVYKGILADGKEVAVKRLSRTSWQGVDEFENELVLIAKLQHRNLVRLVGCAMEGEEKLLVYEFMPNKSLDSFIFEKRSLLDWKTRYNIICGIARGLLYLHEDSRLKIVHRDLKPSNVLLDDEMVAKISDFGLARIFCDDQNTGCTRKVVGTYGYMAPEYAMEGQFSVKSDVFSFGVILLEIISGRKNNDVENSPTLIRHAWQLWRQEREMEFVDPLMGEIGSIEEVIRCIQIGLLCVQADPVERPTMSTVVVQLESGLASLPRPCRPAFSPRVAFTNKSQSST